MTKVLRPPQRRSADLHMRLRPEELELVKRAADRDQVTVSYWARHHLVDDARTRLNLNR